MDLMVFWIIYQYPILCVMYLFKKFAFYYWKLPNYFFQANEPEKTYFIMNPSWRAEKNYTSLAGVLKIYARVLLLLSSRNFQLLNKLMG